MNILKIMARVRFFSAVTAVTLAFTAIAQAAPADIIQEGALETRAIVAPGEHNTYEVIFANQSATSETAILDIELYNERGGRVKQVFQRHSFAPGERHTLTLELPNGTPTGNYVLKAGVFSSDWSALLHWYDRVLTTQVTGPSGDISGPDVTLVSATLDKAVANNPDKVIATAVFQAAGAPSAPVTLDIELYDDNGVQVAQTFWDGEILGSTPFTKKTQVMSGHLPHPGHYTLKVGVFKAGWSELLHWYDHAADLTVL